MGQIILVIYFADKTCEVREPYHSPEKILLSETHSSRLWSSWNTQNLATRDRAQMLPLESNDLTQGFPDT